MYHRGLHWHIRLLLFAALATALIGQTETGQIAGFITDGEGRAVPFATVTVKSTAMDNRRSVRASRQGAFVIPSLLPGEYSVEVTAELYSKASGKVRIHAGSTVEADFQIESSPA